MKLTFTQTEHCTSRANCAVCRSREHGRATRAAWSSVFVMPDGGVDFDCPFGVEWEFEGGLPHSNPQRKGCCGGTT